MNFRKQEPPRLYPQKNEPRIVEFIKTHEIELFMIAMIIVLAIIFIILFSLGSMTESGQYYNKMELI